MKRITDDGVISRRHFLALGGALGAATQLRASDLVELPFDNGRRELVSHFPQKGAMILQRTRPPLLETPFEVFDQGVFTPNDRFYVRWHLPVIPTDIDPAAFRLQVRGQVRQPLTLTLHELTQGFEPVEIAAVNQCSGNSRGLFAPRVPGAQWSNGAMGNALWRGVRLRDVLDRAGILPGAAQVRFKGLDSGALAQTPTFLKSLAIDHARDGEVMIAYAMNGEPLPLLNGFPLRLVVPGWFSTYWIKMLQDIEVIDHADDNYWMSKAYLIPDTPGASIFPGETAKMVPINRLIPRSFFTNLKAGQRLGRRALVRGIAFGGDVAVATVWVSADGGAHYQEARLLKDFGKYSFRQWQIELHFPAPGPQTLMVKSMNTAGVAQPDKANWNGGGYMRNVIESMPVVVV